MKKIIFLCVSAAMVLTSCFKEIDNWYTNTAAYDGRYSIAIICDDDPDLDRDIEEGEELMIYNSAANVANEIIISTHIDDEAIRGKFQITGTPANFSGVNEKTLNLAQGTALTTGNVYYRVNAAGNPSAVPPSGNPGSAGIEYNGVQMYCRLSLDSGKITPNGATTIGGNKSDGVLLEVTLYSEYLIFESYETPQATWANPGVPEFAWRVKDGSRTPANKFEVQCKLDGYRYTGFPEDRPSED